MAVTDSRDSMNMSSLPRAEPDRSTHAEAEAIETAMETGKDRRIRKAAREEQAEGSESDVAGSSFEHDTREHSSRISTVHDGRTDGQSISETRTKARSGIRQRQAQASWEKSSSRLMEGEGSSNESKLIYVDDDEVIPGKGMASSRRRRMAAAAVNEGIHRKVSDQEDENTGVEASHRAEIISEDIVRTASARASRKLRESSSTEIAEREKLRAGEALRESVKKQAAGNAKTEAEHKSRLRKYFQKQRYKRQYAAAKYAEQKGERVIVQNARFTVRVKAALQEAVAGKSRLAIVIGILLLMFFMMMVAISSCTASIHGMTSSIMATTYPSSDEEIHKVEDAYEDMEAKLNVQISRMESTHPEYDEYRYQVDEISHNPYHLISYFTTKYGEFTYDQVKDELAEIFREQYSLSTNSETVSANSETDTENSETEPENSETGTVKILNVIMTNHDLDSVLRARLSSDDEVQYELLNTTYGNRDYLFDLDSLTTYGARGSGSNYKVPPEALSDKRFARMLHEAEKYLGYPYVWGGSSPSTSFDCSGYVSWVINHCGNGWSYGRLGAEGLRQICARVSPANAKPGDLIFFQNTYPCGPGASHVGIYVGNGMMIHCGNPIQYTSVKTAYWQQHFLSYGRLP